MIGLLFYSQKFSIYSTCISHKKLTVTTKKIVKKYMFLIKNQYPLSLKRQSLTGEMHWFGLATGLYHLVRI